MTDPDQDPLSTDEGVVERGPRDTEAEPAPPLPIDSPEQAGPGQQLEAGEG